MNLEDKWNSLLSTSVKSLQCCIEQVHKYPDNKDEYFDKLRDVAKDYCQIDEEHKRCETALEASKIYCEDQENDYTQDMEKLYNNCLNEQANNSNYDKHPIWKRIDGSIKKIDENDSLGDEEIEEDEEVEEGILPSQFEPPLDPITKQVIRDPCRNKLCHHVYELTTILDHLKNIKQNKSRSRCPYIGCTNSNMNSKAIIKDPTLKQQIQQYFANNTKQTVESFSQGDNTL